MSSEAPLRTGWAMGCLYLLAYATWAWFFRLNVDSWARRRLGERLGVKVAWVRATTFPMEVWVWGLGGRSRAPDNSVLNSRIMLGSVAICLAGAFLPTTALCLLLTWSPWLSAELGPALYLTTPLLVLVFAVSHLGWRDSEPAESNPSTDDAKMGAAGTGQPRSRPAARLDTRRES
jgi:hypothetical protein